MLVQSCYSVGLPVVYRRRYSIMLNDEHSAEQSNRNLPFVLAHLSPERWLMGLL